MSYERVVTAALAETQSKFRLAEALALDIPPRRQGGTAGKQPVEAYLREARQAIIDAGGEGRDVRTLSYYRLTALWVAESSNHPVTTFRWLPGVSYSAHKEARAAGMTFAEFAAMPAQTTDAIRATTGRAGTDGQPAAIVSGWSPEQRAEAAREILADPDVAREILADPDVAREVAEAAPGQVGRALAEHHERVRDRVTGSGSPNGELREQAETRIQVMKVLERAAAYRIALTELSSLGRLTDAEAELVAESATRTIMAAEFFTAGNLDISAEAADFLRSQA